jgi:hypothetical protein
MTFIDTVSSQSLPGHLGNALPGTDVLDKGLPKAERSEPLAGAAGSGSHLAGGQAGGPLPGSLPSGEDVLEYFLELDQAERDSAFVLYSGGKTPLDHMTLVYRLRAERVRRLRHLGLLDEAQAVEDRTTREMGA